MSAFDRLAGKLAQQRGVTNPGALAAAIGRKKAAAAGQPNAMGQAAARGVSLNAVLRGKKYG